MEEKDEIEVTPEMIKAAWDRSSNYWDIGIPAPEDFFADIFRVMTAARKASPRLPRVQR